MDGGRESEAAKIALIGGGRMGAALLRGWMDSGISPGQVEIVDPHPSDDLLRICKRHGVRLSACLPAQSKPDVLVLAIKPQNAREVADALLDQVEAGAVVLSIMAGITTRTLREMFPRASGIIRAMPNLAASVSAGVTVAIADETVDSSIRRFTEQTFSTLGLFEWLRNEDEIDAATAISGSGPGYVFLFAECLAKAGIRLGLDPSSAERQARQTIIGAAKLLENSSLQPAQLRQQVTSPGGTTEAALSELCTAPSLLDLIERATTAAAARSLALGR